MGQNNRHKPVFKLLSVTTLVTVLATFCSPSAYSAPISPVQVQSGQDVLTIGVLDLDPLGVDANEARAITERLRIYLSRQQVFEVIERSKMESIMEEMGFQFSGACDTDECVVQVGKVLGASKMVAGSVSKVGNLYSLQVRIVDIATSRIEHQTFKDVTGGMEEVLTTATDQVAQDLAQQVISQMQPGQQPLQPQAGQPTVITTANVRILSAPQGAAIVIGGEEMGVTPLTLELTEGVHEISFRLAGYREATKSIQVIGGQNSEETVTLTEIPTGFLTLTTDPIQCQVFIDGQDAGQLTPFQRFTLYEGSYEIELRKAGYDSETRQVTIRPGGNTNLDVTLRSSGTANITLQSSLLGAKVIITGDGEYRGELQGVREPIQLRPGSYLIQVKAPGYAPWTNEIELQDGDNTVLPVLLLPKSRITAGLLSLALPSTGQFYSGKKGTGVLFLVATAGSVVWGAGQFGQYGTIRDEYSSLVDQYRAASTYQQLTSIKSRIDDKYEELQSQRDKLGTVVTVIGGIWLLNAIEAVALMPRLTGAPGGPGGPELHLISRQGLLSLQLKVAF